MAFSFAIEGSEQLKFFIKSSGTEVVRKGKDLNVTCVPTNSSIAEVEWIQPQGKSNENSNYTIVGNILQLRNIQKAGNYTCATKSTEQDRMERTLIINVQDLPLAPVALRVSEVTDSTIKLTWMYPNSYGVSTSPKPKDIIYYVIQYKERYTSWQSGSNPFEISEVTEHSCTLQQLNSSRDYEIHVMAVNIIGRGPVSLPAYATTKGPGLSSPTSPCIFFDLMLLIFNTRSIVTLQRIKETQDKILVDDIDIRFGECFVPI